LFVPWLSEEEENMSNRKFGYLLLAVLAAALLWNCDPLTGSDVPVPDGATEEFILPPAEGMGAVLVSVEGDGVVNPGESALSRSIMPSAPVFAKYSLAFEYTDPAAGIDDVEIDNIPAGSITGSGYRTDLRPGTWTVTATGWITENGTDYRAAAGSVGGIVVTEGAIATAATVTISPAGIGGSEKGLFSWSISISSTFGAGDTASLTMTKKDAGIPAFTKDLKDTANRAGLIELDPGYYDLAISLNREGKTAGRFEEAHIYPGLKTELPALSFGDTNFAAAVNIAGTVSINKPLGLALSFATITARKDSHSGDLIGQAYLKFGGAGAPAAGEISQQSDEWILTVPQTNLPSNNTYFWTLSATDSGGYAYVAREHETHAVPPEGLTLGDIMSLTIYDISVQSVVSDGTLSVSKPAAVAGETIQIFAVPDPGFNLENGLPTVTKNGGGTAVVNNTVSPFTSFTFEMPDDDVTVWGSFKSTGKEITSFTLAGKPGSITNIGDDTGTISVTVPYGTGLTNIAPDFAYAGASVNYASETPRDFSDLLNPLTYVVTAQDNSTRTYTVTVTVPGLNSIWVDTLPTVTVYNIQSAANTGLDPIGIVVKGLDGGGNPVDITGYTLSYDFTTPGTKLVTVTYNGSSTNFPVKVVGLTSLGVSGYAFSVPFNQADPSTGITNYSLAVPYAVTSVSVTAVESAGGAIEIDGGPATSNVPKTVDNISIGTNTIAVRTNIGSVEKSYTITVNRLSNNTDLSGLTVNQGTLSPGFSAVTTGYTVSVANSVSSIDVTATKSHANASIKINGDDYTSGDVKTISGLVIGTNTITIAVLSQDGTVTKTYTITVNRMSNTAADLTGLTVSSGTLSPAFAANMLTYTVNVVNTVTSITVTAFKSDPNSAVTIDGTAYTSYGTTAQKTISGLTVGTAKSIPVIVTPQSGTTKTYTITVNRQSNNTDLTTLTISTGTLSPGFSEGTTAYTVKVPFTTPAITVTATKTGAYSKITIAGTDYNSGTPTSESVALSAFPLSVVVSSEDGTAAKTYTLSASFYGVTTIAGADSYGGFGGFADGTAAEALFKRPMSVVLAGNGNIYVVDYGNDRIRMLTPGGGVSTLAGSGSVGGYADGPGTQAQFNGPYGIAMDGSGYLYVADSNNHRIRKVFSDGAYAVETFAGSTYGYADGTGADAQFNQPIGIAVHGADFYVVDNYNYRIRKMTATTGAIPKGVVTTFAGAGTQGYAEGTGTAAQFYSPRSITVDNDGNVYVADFHRIRKITPGGEVTTFAGSTSAGYADGTGTAAQFTSLYGIAADNSGNLYVSEWEDHRIRKITPGGEVTTFAGSGTEGYADGDFSAAQFKNPQGIAVDGDGNVYVADCGNHRIRKIVPGP
jgi:sugar lactone lactonase YvrE